MIRRISASRQSEGDGPLVRQLHGFNDEKGPIRPTIKPMLEVKNRGKHKYYQSLERIWARMEERKRVEE